MDELEFYKATLEEFEVAKTRTAHEIVRMKVKLARIVELLELLKAMNRGIEDAEVLDG